MHCLQSFITNLPSFNPTKQIDSKKTNRLYRYFKLCESVRVRERDEHIVKKTLDDFSSGKVVVYTGLGHTMDLKNLFEHKGLPVTVLGSSSYKPLLGEFNERQKNYDRLLTEFTRIYK